MLHPLELFWNLFGSRKQPAPRPKARPSVVLRLEWLEDRLTPSGGGPNSDTLVWKPVVVACAA
jgi:hypothetical protein